VDVNGDPEIIVVNNASNDILVYASNGTVSVCNTTTAFIIVPILPSMQTLAAMAKVILLLLCQFRLAVLQVPSSTTDKRFGFVS
jgi:hypothetical protein